MRLFILFLMGALFLAACNGALAPALDQPIDPDSPVSNDPGYPNPVNKNDAAPNPYLPQPSDETLSRENVYIESADLLIMESYPAQIVLNLGGSLPTPCNQLRLIIAAPDANNNIAIEAYSVIDPGIACAQVLQPFEAGIPLGSFNSGHYTVFVNGRQVGTFDT